MQTRISLDFNVDGITKVIQETNKLEKKFEAVGDKISSQSNKVKNLVSSVKELNALLNGKSELGGAGNVEAFSESVQSSLLQAIEMAKQLQTALNNINVPAEIAGGLNTIVDTGNKVINSSALSYSKSDMRAYEKMVNQKSVSTSKQSSISALEKQIVSYADTLDDISGKYKNGFDDLLKVSPNNIKDVAAYGQALSKIEGYMDRYVSLTTKAKKGLNLSDLDNKYQVFGENFEAGKLNISRDLKYAFSQYGRFSDYNNLKNFQEELSENNKNLPKSADIKVKATPTVDTKEAEKQAENSAPIKVTVDKDALTNDITTAIQSKEYTINVKPQQNIADDIQKQLEGKVANINIVAGASKGVASVNSQISDFQSTYDKYVGIVNSGKGSTASLLKKYPLLSDYHKGMDVEKTKSELTGKFANQITAGSNKEIEQLSKSLTALTEASGGSEKVVESFNAIRNSAQTILPPDFDEKILNLIDGLELLESHLAKSDIGSSPFIKTINELLSKGDELKALASVLADAQKGAGKSLAKEATKEEKIVRANQSDINTVWNSSVGQMSYSGIEQAIIERSALRGKDITDMDQLRKDIALNLTKQGSIKNAEQMYDKLAESKAKINNIHINEDDEAESFERATRWVLRYREALDEVVKSPTKANLNRVAFTEAAANKYFDRSTGLQDNYAKTTQVNKIRDSVSKDINQNSKMPLELQQRYKDLQAAMEATYDSQGNKIAVTTEQYNKMQAVYSNLRAEMQATGQVGNSLFTKLGTGLGARIVQFTSFYLSFYRVIQYMRQGIETLEQFNTTLTKISYTMNISEGTLEEMGNTMQSLALELSAPLENVEQIYTVYANMKTNPEEIEKLTRYTTILSNLAGIDAGTAADDVQGVINQFDLAAEDTAHVVDTFDYISSNIAVDYSKGIEGLAEAVQGSGNVAKMAGLSFEQYGSIIAKTMEQTRMDGSRISNALRTIMTRLSKASSMDDTVNNATLSKASEALNKIGIQVYTTAGEYREFDTIMTELAGKWDSLTDSQRENISFAIAATRQTAMLKSVLNNWTDSMDLATEATNNNGSALKNQEKYEKSYVARIQKIKTGLQNFAVDFFDGQAFSDAIRAIEGLTKALEALGSVLGNIGVITGTLAARSVFSKKGAIGQAFTYDKNAEKGDRLHANFRQFLPTSRKDRETYNANLKTDIERYRTMYKNNGVKEANKYLASLEGTTAGVARYNEEQQLRIQTETAANKNTEEMVAGMKKYGVGAKLASGATKVLSGVLTGLAVGLVTSAISAGIDYLISLYDRADQLKDGVKKFNDEIKQSNTEYNNNLKLVKNYDKTYEALAGGVDKQGKNLSLTSKDFEKYNNVANQVAELIPELVTGWTEEGNAIIDLTSNYKDLTEAYEYYAMKRKSEDYYSSEGKDKISDAVDYWNEVVTDKEGDNFWYDAMQKIAEWGYRYVPGFKPPRYGKTDDDGEMHFVDLSAKKQISQLKNALLLKDKDAKKYLDDETNIDSSEYTDENGKFSRSKATAYLSKQQSVLNQGREGLKNVGISYLSTLYGTYTTETIKAAQDVLAKTNGAIFDGAESQEDVENISGEFIANYSKLSKDIRDKVSDLYTSPILGMTNVDEYLQTAQQYATGMGKGKLNQEVADQLGFGEQYRTANAFKGFLGEKRSKKNQKILDQILEMTNIKTEEDLNDLKQRLNEDGYDATLKYYSQKRFAGGKDFDFDKSWKEMGQDETYQKTQQDLLELANQGKLTIDTFKNVEGADQWIKDIGVAAEDVVPEINKLADSAKQLGSLAGTVGTIREAYGEKRDEGIVGATTLSSMADTFGELDYWGQYEKIVGQKSSSLAQVKAASDKLLTEYVNTGEYLSKLTEDNKQFYIDQLSDMGVANAAEVVNEKLAQQKTIIDDIQGATTGDKAFGNLSQGAQDAAYNFSTLQAATAEEIGELALLSNISDYTRISLLQLQMSKIDWSGLDAQSAINQLLSIADAAKEAGINLSMLPLLKKAQKALDNPMQNIRNRDKGKGVKIDANYIKNARKELSKAFNNKKDKLGTTKINMSTAGIDSKSGSSKGKGGSSSNTKQEFDWLDRRVSIITSKVDLLKSKLENLFSMKKKQNNLNKQIKEQTKLIKTYTKEVSIYGKKAGAVKLSSSLKKKVRNGRLKGTKAQLIQKYGEKTANKIEKYQDWYDKKQAAKKNKQEAIAARRQLKIDKQQLYVDKYNAKAEYKDLQSTSGMVYAKKRNEALTQEYKYIQKSYKHQIKIAKINHDSVQVAKLQLELRNKEVEIQKKKFDNVADQYDKLVTILGYGVDKIEGEISLITARGAKVDVNKYRDEAQQHLDRQELLKLEKAELQQRIKTIKRGTAEWYDANDKLNSIDKQINEEGVATVEAMNKVREAYTDLYNAIRDQIRRAASERSFAGELLSNYSLFDYDTGVITDYGKAYSSNVVSQLYEFNNAAAVDKAELERLQSYASGKTGVTKAGQDLGYQSRKALDADIEDAYNKWQEDLKDISNLQSDIFKFAEDSLKKEEDLLKKLIDKRKEELDAAKDLHDYQKSIQEKTKNINDIQRQISAYRGDTSQEGMSKLQQLQKQLIEAQDDLQETEYDKYISDQKQMLDNLYQDYQDMLEALLSDFKNVVENKLEEIKQYTEEGNRILVKFLSEEFGYKMQYSENGSESGVNQMSDELKKVQTQLSGTQGDKGKTPNQQQAADTAKRTVQQTKEDYWKSIYNKETVRQAGDVFAHTLVKGKKKKASDYKTSINQYLFTKNNKKVLSNSGLERMRMVLGIADNTEMLEILQWLNKNVGNIPHVKGFAKGGIVGDVVKRNGDDGFATLKVGEAVLTPLQAKQFKELVTSLPSLNSLVDGLTNVKDVGLGVQTSDTYNSTFNFEISDVQNATELLNAIKSDDKVQRALQEVTIKQLNKGSRLGVKKIS